MVQYNIALSKDLDGQKTTALPLDQTGTAAWTTPVHVTGGVGYDKQDDMYKVKTNQKKWKADFSGTSLNTSMWEVVQTGTGQTITVASGILSVAMGTTVNAETVLLSKETFTIPVKAMFALNLSQKIAQNEVYMELVAVDPVTGVVDTVTPNIAAWKVSGTDNTGNTYAVYQNQAMGIPLTSSAATNTISAQTGAGVYSIFEIEPYTDELWFHTKVMDSANGRSYSAVRHQNIPNPNAVYKVRLRIKNGTTAPASATTVNFQFVNVNDYAELTAEVTAGRGNTSAGQGMAMYAVGGTLSVSNSTVQGTQAHDAATANNPMTIGARAINVSPTAVSATGDVTNLYSTMHGALVVREHCIPEVSWSYTGVQTTTTATAAKAAGAAGIRNYVNGFQFQNSNATATEIQILDGVTVIWKGYASANMAMPVNISFDQPLRGTAATALNVNAVTTGANVYINVQGYQAP
jgi:hypothetical protein